MGNSHFETITDESLTGLVQRLGTAAYTLFDVPDHDSSLYEEVQETMMNVQVPLQDPVHEEINSLINGPLQLVDVDIRPQLSNRTALSHLAVFMQFVSYQAENRPYGQTPFKYIDALHEETVSQAAEQPVGFSQQLTIALKQTEGDLPEALWRLFVTSRQEARWFDSRLLLGLPNFSRAEKLQRMLDFSSAVAACKSYDGLNPQDTSGDNYYAWTHAIGRVMFGALVDKRSMIVKIGGKTMFHGTHLMHGLAHKFKAQRVPSDHTRASMYGNAIGNTLADYLNDAGQGFLEID